MPALPPDSETVLVEREDAYPWRVHYQGPWRRGTFLVYSPSYVIAERRAANAVCPDERVLRIELVEC